MTAERYNKFGKNYVFLLEEQKNLQKLLDENNELSKNETVNLYLDLDNYIQKADYENKNKDLIWEMKNEVAKIKEEPEVVRYLSNKEKIKESYKVLKKEKI